MANDEPASIPRVIRQLILTTLGTLYTYRAPMLLGSIVLGIALGHKSPMISGLFALNHSDQMWLSLLVTSIGTQIFVTTRILQLNGPARLNFNPDLSVPKFVPGLRPYLRFGWVVILAALPIGVFEYQLFAIPNSSPGKIVTGAVIALAIFSFCVAVENLFSPRHSEQVVPIKFLRDFHSVSHRGWRKVSKRLSVWFCWCIRILDDTGQGYFVNNHVLPGHFLALFGTVLLSILYFAPLLLNVIHPATHYGPGYVKAIFYALISIAFYGSVVSFACFLMDRHRIPVITLLVLFSFAVSLSKKNSHYYEIFPAPETPKALNAGALWNGGNDQVIIVSSQGGGIQAAAWTTRVLLGIVQQLPPHLQLKFVQSVRLLSGVSGGSVGQMFFQTLYSHPDALAAPVEHLKRVHTAGVCGTALSWIGYGVTYYDLFRPTVPFLNYSLKDRGWGAEQAWHKLLQDGLGTGGDVTMNELRSGVAEGNRPLMVFNATNADLGVPIVISNFDFVEDRRKHDFDAFHNLYRGYDLKLTTAVRLSAAFPYVSPSPRPFAIGTPLAKRPYSLIDGGLYDNFGVAGAYFTLQQATEGFKISPSKQVIWIQIRLPDADLDNSKLLSSTMLGPLITLNNTRVTGQRSRADQLSELAVSRLGTKLTIIPFDYPKFNAPLSWALSSEQIQEIDQGWRELKLGHKQISSVCLALGGNPAECERAASPWLPNAGNDLPASELDFRVCPEDDLTLAKYLPQSRQSPAKVPPR